MIHVLERREAFGHTNALHPVSSNGLKVSLGFPLGLENLGKWEGVLQSGKSQGILNRLEKSGKISQNTEKVREFQKNVIYYILVIF